VSAYHGVANTLTNLHPFDYGTATKAQVIFSTLNTARLLVNPQTATGSRMR